MMSLDIDFLTWQAIPIEIGGPLQKLGEFKGRQDLFTHQTPQALETLKEIAIIESTESSNRIEGVTIPAKRFKELMAHPVKPKDRSEAEILGYREVLSSIHSKPETFTIDEKTILGFHKQIYARTDIPGGQWKKRDNTIEERVGTIAKSRGIKTAIVEETIKNLPSTFSISDVERLCPSVSRDMIRVILNHLRKEGCLNCKGTGRGALWEKRGNNLSKRSNKRSNNA